MAESIDDFIYSLGAIIFDGSPHCPLPMETRNHTAGDFGHSTQSSFENDTASNRVLRNTNQEESQQRILY